MRYIVDAGKDWGGSTGRVCGNGHIIHDGIICQECGDYRYTLGKPTRKGEVFVYTDAIPMTVTPGSHLRGKE